MGAVSKSGSFAWMQWNDQLGAKGRHVLDAHSSKCVERKGEAEQIHLAPGWSVSQWQGYTQQDTGWQGWRAGGQGSQITGRIKGQHRGTRN